MLPNGQGSQARPGRGRRCAQASPSQLALHPRGLGFVLTARAIPLRLALCPLGLGFAHAACATRSQLGLCPHGLALPSRLTLCARGLGCGGGGGGGGGGSSGSDGGKCLPLRLALRARRLGLCPRGSALPALPSWLVLSACSSALLKHNNQTAKQRPQKLLRQRCRLSAVAVAAGSSSAGSCGGISCGSVGGSISISGNGSGGGGGSSGRWWWRRQKWRRQ